MTHGNLQVDPRAGLLFIDFESGDVLQLTGVAVVLHEETSLPGAQRAVKVQQGWCVVLSG